MKYPGRKPVIYVTFIKISVKEIQTKKRDTITIFVIYNVYRSSCDLILSQYIAVVVKEEAK
ncbi:MAG: hypothetical protein EA391_12575 [Balneolaceae bacterium]|nr:MAG: hypothetical protein EA391_12575 [Balneolaceae bacterium]